MCISVHQLCYVHADKEPLFQHINLIVNKGDRVALIGNNGIGKSTLLRIIAGELNPSSGDVVCSSQPYYVPQHFGQYDNLTVAEALRVAPKLKALHAILNGEATTDNFSILNDDWDIEERCLSALAFWDLPYLRLDQPMSMLSGGEKTKVFLSGIQVHSPEIILMDEPTNHLDVSGRQKLYRLAQTGRATLLVVSHDRTLLSLLPAICELERNTVTLYGGNYDFYKEQKEIALQALQNQLDEKEKAYRLARKTAREALERKDKANVRGEKANIKKGLPRIMLNSLKSKSERSTDKLKEIHEDKQAALLASINDIRKNIPDGRELQTDFNSPNLHVGKILVTADRINFGYASSCLWDEPLSFQIRSGDRIRISGGNGSGKTTLVKLLLGSLEPVEGHIVRASFTSVYIDQECSLIDGTLTVFEQLEQFNTAHKPEHELKTILNRFLFPYGTWDKSCSCLSGGEKIRLLFCCLMVGNNTPDIFILDEPTNNLDIQSVEIITTTIQDYKGTVLLISHDFSFVEEIKIDRTIELFASGTVIKI